MRICHYDFVYTLLLKLNLCQTFHLLLQGPPAGRIVFLGPFVIIPNDKREIFL